MNRESMIAERVAKGLTAKTVNNERDMLSELNDLQRKAQEWEKKAKDAVKAGKLDELTAKRYEKLSDYLEGAWVTTKAILDAGKLLTEA